MKNLDLHFELEDGRVCINLVDNENLDPKQKQDFQKFVEDEFESFLLDLVGTKKVIPEKGDKFSRFIDIDKNNPIEQIIVIVDIQCAIYKGEFDCLVFTVEIQ